MFKTTYMSTAMLASISAGVNIRETTQSALSDLLAQKDRLAQKGRLAQTTKAETPFYLAQQSTEHGHRCTTTMERNWNTTDDYTTWRQGTTMYNDVNFPKEDMLYWADTDERNGDMSSLSNQITMMRVSDAAFPSSTFWGPGGNINPQDINQGYIGNCWIMAAISALAEHPERVDRMMISDGIEDTGMYAMNFYSLGVPYTQIIDDWMPMNGGNTVFAGLGKDGSTWGAIVEKHFAKWYGNYEHLVGGWMADAVSAMNGSPYDERSSSNYTSQQLWDWITAANMDNDIITAGSNNCGSDA